MEVIDRPRLNLADFIKPESSLKFTYETLLKEDSVNKLRFTPDHKIYPFNIFDFDLQPDGIISSEKCIVKKYLHKPSKQIIAVKYVHVPHCIYKDEKREKEMQKLIQEIKIHQQLSFSKHIIKLYGFCIYEGDALICMELMDMSLKEFYMNVHEKYNHFPEDLLGVICVSIVSAFQDLHRVEIIHRDIKPNNILINSNGQIKLCDFGEARLLENNLATSIVGTVAYWPPERMKGKRAYDSRSDIWSLGITLAELIYGRLPFEDESGNELDNCVMVMCYIMSLNTAELVHKCFSKTNCSYEYARDFVASCLGQCEDRPNYEDLLKTAFYRRYCDLPRDKIVQKYMDSSSLGNANKRRQSSSISNLETYTHWERNLNGKVLSKENKKHLNDHDQGFKIPRRYIPKEKVGGGVRGVAMKAFDNKLYKFVAIKGLSYYYMKTSQDYRSSSVNYGKLIIQAG
uniref:mitogen-activated protein kinase kinase n=1 Tax=Acrobeloides nanus TaxID=290746 RepID=A0A914E650_9BILA